MIEINFDEWIYQQLLYLQKSDWIEKIIKDSEMSWQFFFLIILILMTITAFFDQKFSDSSSQIWKISLNSHQAIHNFSQTNIIEYHSFFSDNADDNSDNQSACQK